MTTAMNPSRHRVPEAAFTLVELLIVIAVLVIAAAIVVPNIGTAADAQALSAARAMASDLEMARNQALKTQRPHTVLFSDNRQSYKVVADYAGESYANAQPIAHPIVSGKAYEVTPSQCNGMGSVSIANVSFMNGYVTFNALGEASPAGTVTVQAGSTQVEVSVAGLTGSVSIERTAN